MFDYDEFVERNIPSDIQLEKRFPGDPVKKTMHRDFVTERQLLEEYWQWCDRMRSASPQNASFHRSLFNEILFDYVAVGKEFSDTMGAQPDTLGVWEYWNLDRNGDTETMCRKMKDGYDIFNRGDIGVREYGHLAPPGYFKAIRRMRMMEWDLYMLDNAAGGTNKLERMLKHNVDVFGGEEYPEAKKRYKHLIPKFWEPLISIIDWFEEHEEDHTVMSSDEAGVLWIKERYMHITKDTASASQAPPVSTKEPRTLGHALTLSFGIYTEHTRTTGHLGLRLSSLPPLSLLGSGSRPLP